MQKTVSMFRGLNDFLGVRVARARRTSPKTLPVLLLWITDACNLQCRMCGDRWRSQRPETKPLLSSDRWCSVIDSAKELNTKIISLTGGEPLLYPDFFRIVDHICNKGIACHICTNGTLLREKNVKQLAERKIQSISVSLDSIDASTHNYLRGRDCFDEVVCGIRRLRNAMVGLKIIINFTMCRLNFREMSDMVRLGKELRVDQINFAPVHTNLQHKRKPVEEFHELILRKEDISTVPLELARLKKTASDLGIRISSSTFLDGIPRFFNGRSRWHRCFAGYVSCAVSPWGETTPCADLYSRENVRDKPLHRIWRDGVFKGLRKKVERCKQPFAGIQQMPN
jgi:MoaA/NifB/PqqE/SkfB family radical SAM enzyme